MEIFITSLITFVSTNIDDIFILMLFYGDRRLASKEIIFGQLLGIAALVLISLIASLAGLFIGKAYIGLLGLFPVYLGIKGILTLFSKKEEEQSGEDIKRGRSNILSIAGVTIANGGDNVGIYVPLFTTLSRMEKSTMILVFFMMTIVWCLIAKYLTKHPYVAKIIEKYGHIITPFVLIVLGCYILHESGTLEIIARK